MKKRRIISGITSSSFPTLAHYLIIFKNLIKLQKEYDLFFLIGDLHSISTRKENEEIPIFQEELAKIAFACGIEKENVYIQSQIQEHTMLSCLLSSFQPVGQLNRMTQFKSKINKGVFQSLGLYSYPVLMASDILLFDADVLIGPDQKQHLELTRDLCNRFNKQYKNVFKLPEIIEMSGTNYRIRDLQNPDKKMSKSVKNKLSTIFLNDSIEEITKKIKSCKTDSENLIKFDFENKPGVSNLILIYSLCNEKNIFLAEKELKESCNNYLDLKLNVLNSIINTLKPIQYKVKYFNNNPKILKEYLNLGFKRAKEIAEKKMKLINKKVGVPYL